MWGGQGRVGVLSRNGVSIGVPLFQYDVKDFIVGTAGWSRWGGGGFPASPVTLGGVVGGAVVFRFVRVDACADEIRLMGVGRNEVSTDVFEVERYRGSFVRNSSNARVPPVMERIWRGPCGEGANCTMQFVERGGRLRDRRCALAGRFLATKGSRS